MVRHTESKALSRAREWAAGRIKQLGLATKSGFVGTGEVGSLSPGSNSGHQHGASRKRTMDSSLGSTTIPPPSKRQRRSDAAADPPPKGSGLKKR